jgi:hypothetical protein
MHDIRRLACLAAFLAAHFLAIGQPEPVIRSPQLADYDAENRLPNGRVDTDVLVHRLSELGVTTYYWLVWHAPTDWDDLKLFLPKANQAHIAVWVYLVPPTEGPPNGYPASEPFKLDYPRWAQEIARLSLAHTNLTAWVIDDFYANHQLFTPAYVREMRAASRRINPQLAFLPLMYFPELTRRFVEDYHEVIDGVVAAYPGDREEINNARAILNGELLSIPGELSCPWSTPTKPGDFVSASVTAQMLSAERARVRFREQVDFTGPTKGYHFKQVLLDSAVVWEEDVAGGTNGWRNVDLDVSAQTRGKTNVTLSFRLFDKKGVSNFGVRWRLGGLQTEGLQPEATLAQPARWRVELHGPWEAGFGPALGQRGPSLHVPFIVMTAASADEFRLRHGEPATPARISEWLRLCLDAWREGRCDGVVTYCLDKQPRSQVFPLARTLFLEYRPTVK